MKWLLDGLSNNTMKKWYQSNINTADFRNLYKTQYLNTSQTGDMMILREQDKHFLWSIYSAVAIIMVWKGMWEGAYEVVPEFLADPFIFLFLGFLMLTFSGLIFKEFDPLGGVEKSVQKIINTVHNHPNKSKFQMKYYDKSQKKFFTISVDKIIKVEKGALVVRHDNKNQELFIPIHRVSEILYQGKEYWKL